MKKIYIPVVFLLLFALLCGCSKESATDTTTTTATLYEKASANGHQIYVRDPYGESALQATFVNTDDNSSVTYEMELIDKGEDYNTYTTYGDTEKYNRVYFSANGKDTTVEFAFNDFSNGYRITGGSGAGYSAIPFLYDTEEKTYSYETVALKYDNTEKNIFIWVPDNYNQKDKATKYSVIYMADGQNLFDEYATNYGNWGVAQSAVNMMAESDNKCIIVGINDGDGNRDSELTPNLGEVQWDNEEFKNGTGEVYCDFVYNTVVPYIEKNYNVYTDPEHNSVCGSSSGGIEAFYIGMEHPDKFGTIGALSPAFCIFSEEVWDNYLSKLKFNNNEPFVYIYNGQGDELETSLAPQAKDMENYLKKINYPSDKIKVEIYKDGSHNEGFWRGIFPEFLKYAFE